jgi:hypothetical protein
MSETSATPAKVSASKHKTIQHELHRMEIEKADNGGYSVTHHFRPKNKKNRGEMTGSYRPSEIHVMGNAADMHAHVQKHYPSSASDKAASNDEGVEEMPTAKGA